MEVTTEVIGGKLVRIGFKNEGYGSSFMINAHAALVLAKRLVLSAGLIMKPKPGSLVQIEPSDDPNKPLLLTVWANDSQATAVYLSLAAARSLYAMLPEWVSIDPPAPPEPGSTVAITSHDRPAGSFSFDKPTLPPFNVPDTPDSFAWAREHEPEWSYKGSSWDLAHLTILRTLDFMTQTQSEIENSFGTEAIEALADLVNAGYVRYMDRYSPAVYDLGASGVEFVNAWNEHLTAAMVGMG